ncbi:MAG TPA: fatty acid cis/trans isomerase, partial [Bacteroidales bacterium]|nr:fatty acid cis/trans isomerase [Bacteroidales bacterium]
FTADGQRVDYRLVRSSTDSGKPIRELATVHPNDFPGSDPFFYRLRRVNETLLDKTHFEYPLDDEALRNIKAIFFSPFL